MGNLTSVVLPNGDVVSYSVDGQNRRIARKLNGVVTQQWLYGDQLSLVAELDGNGAIVSRFLHGALVLREGAVCRIIKDHIGTPLLVVDSTTGQILHRQEIGPWGEALQSTNLAWLPFGFGGGLRDDATGFLRLGERDYAPSLGRWVAKDRAGLEAGSNLYQYVGSAPTVAVDPSGREAENPAQTAGDDSGSAASAGTEPDECSRPKPTDQHCRDNYRRCVDKAKSPPDITKCDECQRDCERHGQWPSYKCSL